ncbi:MAG TPA: hypothetical protein VIP98_01850 [Microlunatus sp.]
MARSLRFPEVLVGSVRFPESKTSEAGLRAYPFTMRLRWDIPDLDAFIEDPRHTVTVTGRIVCEPLGGDLPVANGLVELFAVDAGRVVMNYLLRFDADNGQRLELRGAKQIVHDRAKDLWPDTTTLPVEIRQTTGDQRLVVAGQVRLTLPRVMQAIITMRAPGTARVKIGTILAFDRFFVAELAHVYLAAVRPTDRRRSSAGS